VKVAALQETRYATAGQVTIFETTMAPGALIELRLRASVALTTILLAVEGPRLVNVIRYETGEPVYASGGPEMVRAKSACGWTVVSSRAGDELPLLFARFGSAVVALTEAVFVSRPDAGARTLTEQTKLRLLPRLPSGGQVTRLPAPSAPPPLALTKVTPKGSFSTTIMLLEVEGPRFVTDSE
jgi:hypothetical protein